MYIFTAALFIIAKPKTIIIQHKKRLKVKVKSLSHVRLFATLWTVAYHTPSSMTFSRQEYWSGLPLQKWE